MIPPLPRGYGTLHYYITPHGVMLVNISNTLPSELPQPLIRKKGAPSLEQHTSMNLNHTIIAPLAIFTLSVT